MIENQQNQSQWGRSQGWALYLEGDRGSGGKGREIT